MRMTAMILIVTTLAGAAPVHASECGQQIQAVEQRMQSAGESQASNVDGQAPTPTSQSQQPTVAKLEVAQSLIKIAKAQDASGNKVDCEKTIADLQARIGSLP